MADLIDRQEALEGLYDVFFDDELSAAYPKEADKVLDVIRKLPSANYQQVTGKLDCISRQEALDAVFNNAEHPDKAYGAIRHLPSAQPKTPPYVAEIESEYKKWVNVPQIDKPLAKALYEVWKKHDREDVNRNG